MRLSSDPAVRTGALSKRLACALRPARLCRAPALVVGAVGPLLCPPQSAPWFPTRRGRPSLPVKCKCSPRSPAASSWAPEGPRAGAAPWLPGLDVSPCPRLREPLASGAGVSASTERTISCGSRSHWLVLRGGPLGRGAPCLAWPEFRSLPFAHGSRVSGHSGAGLSPSVCPSAVDPGRARAGPTSRLRVSSSQPGPSPRVGFVEPHCWSVSVRPALPRAVPPHVPSSLRFVTPVQLLGVGRGEEARARAAPPVPPA